MVARSRIAVVGPDRQIHVVELEGGARRQVSYSRVPNTLSRWGAPTGEDGCTWPCWSPDGRWLACFRGRGGDDGPHTVTALEVDGVEERELLELHDQHPIYTAWSPHGDRLAVLAQDAGDLTLSTCRLDIMGQRAVVDEGVPLFFTWTPDGDRLLVHVGGSEGGRLVVRPSDGRGDSILYDEEPGSFCSPIFCGDRAVYVVSRGPSSWLCTSTVDGDDSRVLGTWPGLMAVLPSPVGPELVLGSAPGGEGTPYDGLWLVPLDGSPPTRLTEERCMAFFWDPRGRFLVVAALDMARAALRWKLLDLESGRTRELCSFHPSRDQMFYLHFFEQYARTHPLISPDGGTLIFASHATPGYGRRDDEGCRVMALDLTEIGATPRVLAEGSFGVFAPRVATDAPLA